MQDHVRDLSGVPGWQMLIVRMSIGRDEGGQCVQILIDQAAGIRHAKVMFCLREFVRLRSVFCTVNICEQGVSSVQQCVTPHHGLLQSFSVQRPVQSSQERSGQLLLMDYASHAQAKLQHNITAASKDGVHLRSGLLTTLTSTWCFDCLCNMNEPCMCSAADSRLSGDAPWAGTAEEAKVDGTTGQPTLATDFWRPV